MYKYGHVGAALLLYAPVGFLLLTSGLGELAVLGGLLSIALSTLPDADHSLPLVSHRGITHTVYFALGIGVFVGLLGYLSADLLGYDPLLLAAVGFGVSTLAICSHLLADSITPMGIRPFAPLWGWHYSANVVPAKNPIANFLLLATGIMAVTVALVLAVVTL